MRRVADAMLVFKAIQTHEGGEKVRLTGPKDADQPAPRVTLTAPAPRMASRRVAAWVAARMGRG